MMVIITDMDDAWEHRLSARFTVTWTISVAGEKCTLDSCTARPETHRTQLHSQQGEVD
jgi:hypothetical protein